MAANPQSEVRLNRIRKTYGDAVAVDDLELHIASGSFTCLLGPSGCGKTTTLRILAGLITPDSGTVEIDGRDMTDLPPQKRPTSIVFQDYALFPHMTVTANVKFGLTAQKVSKNEQQSRIEETLGLLGLTELADRYPRELSGGQQQRVALARSLVTQPRVLLMDEPLSNLDAKMRLELRSSLRALQRRLGITTVYVTHDQEEALAMADQVAVMSEGRLQQVGGPAEVYDQPANVFVSDFIGGSNILPGTCIEVTNDVIKVDVDGDTLTAVREQQRYTPEVGTKVAACIRGNGMRFVSEPELGHTLTVQIKDHQFTGNAMHYVLEKAGRRLTYHDADIDERPRQGQTYMRISPTRLRVLPPAEDSNGDVETLIR